VATWDVFPAERDATPIEATMQAVRDEYRDWNATGGDGRG
jgi:hypothetical protein